MSALAAGWAGEPETKAAMLLVLVGVIEVGKAPAQQILRMDEEEQGAPNRAVWELAGRWGGDADVKAALLRVLIGVLEPGMAPSGQVVPPHSSLLVRRYAAEGLGEGWKGDAEVKAALEQVATGKAADGSPIEEDEIVRKTAQRALANWPK